MSDLSPQFPSLSRRLSWLDFLVRWPLFLATIFCVAWALTKMLKPLNWATLHFRLLPLILCIAALIGIFVAQLVVYRQLIKAYARAVPWSSMVPIAWVSALGKYVPGNFAAVAGKMYLLRQCGIPGPVSFSLAVMQDGMAAVAGLIVAAPMLLCPPLRSAFPHAWIWSLLLVLLGVLLLHPRVFALLVNLILRKLKLATLRSRLTPGEYVAPLVATFLQWLFAGISLWCMTRSLSDIPLSNLPFCLGAAALAMTIGYLVLFAPGGLGVREGVLLLLFVPLIGKEHAGILVLAHRVAQTLVELLLAGIGLLFLRRHAPG